jgi:hypothetical protein
MFWGYGRNTSRDLVPFMRSVYPREVYGSQFLRIVLPQEVSVRLSILSRPYSPFRKPAPTRLLHPPERMRRPPSDSFPCLWCDLMLYRQERAHRNATKETSEDVKMNDRQMIHPPRYPRACS